MALMCLRDRVLIRRMDPSTGLYGNENQENGSLWSTIGERHSGEWCPSDNYRGGLVLEKFKNWLKKTKNLEKPMNESVKYPMRKREG
jgi:hypothetical protein